MTPDKLIILFTRSNYGFVNFNHNGINNTLYVTMFHFLNPKKSMKSLYKTQPLRPSDLKKIYYDKMEDFNIYSLVYPGRKVKLSIIACFDGIWILWSLRFDVTEWQQRICFRTSGVFFINNRTMHYDIWPNKLPNTIVRTSCSKNSKSPV